MRFAAVSARTQQQQRADLRPRSLDAAAGDRFNPRRRARSSVTLAVFASSSASSPPPPPPPPPPPSLPDFNALQTRLIRAIEAEDYAEAARARDALREASEAEGRGGEASSSSSSSLSLLPAWRDLPLDPESENKRKKTPEWLAQRAEQLGYLYPTDIQRRAYEALSTAGKDAVVVAQTGSGKTLAFLMPLLSRLDYGSRVVEGNGDSTSPESSSLPPLQLVVVVPTRDLGVQTALLVYRLLGGSFSTRTPGSKANMFSFTGPRGLLVRGVLDEGEALRARVGGGLKGATVVVGTPDMLLEACPQSSDEEGERSGLSEPNIFPLGSTAAAIAVDEADACLDLHGDCLSKFLLAAQAAAALEGNPRPDVVLVGASAVSGGAVEAGVEGGWLREDATLVVGAGMEASTSSSPSSSDPPSSSSSSSSSDPPAAPAALLPQIPSSIRHRVCAVPAPEDALPALARLLRGDAAAVGPDAPAPRTIAFVRDEQTAKSAAKALRASLWGVHTLAVLLPTGREPTRAAHAFRDGRASLLLATPAAARGLDLPAVEAVYSLGPPVGGAADYLHRAGRAGRLGSSSGLDKDRAVVTSVVVAGGEEERALREAAAALGVELESVEVPAPSADFSSERVPAEEEEAEEGEGAPAASAGAKSNGDNEALRRGLEDIFWTREAPEPEATRGRALGGRAAEEEEVDESDDDDEDGGQPEDREE